MVSNNKPCNTTALRECSDQWPDCNVAFPAEWINWPRMGAIVQAGIGTLTHKKKTQKTPPTVCLRVNGTGRFFLESARLPPPASVGPDVKRGRLGRAAAPGARRPRCEKRAAGRAAARGALHYRIKEGHRLSRKNWGFALVAIAMLPNLMSDSAAELIRC